MEERVGIEGEKIVRIVEEMEKDGIIKRIVEDEDSSVKIIKMKEEGREVEKKVEK